MKLNFDQPIKLTNGEDYLGGDPKGFMTPVVKDALVQHHARVHAEMTLIQLQEFLKLQTRLDEGGEHEYTLDEAQLLQAAVYKAVCVVIDKDGKHMPPAPYPIWMSGYIVNYLEGKHD